MLQVTSGPVVARLAKGECYLCFNAQRRDVFAERWQLETPPTSGGSLLAEVKSLSRVEVMTSPWMLRRGVKKSEREQAKQAGRAAALLVNATLKTITRVSLSCGYFATPGVFRILPKI